MMSGSSLSLGTDDTCESHDRLPQRKVSVAPPKPKRSSWAGTVEKEDLKDTTSASPLELLKVTTVLLAVLWQIVPFIVDGFTQICLCCHCCCFL